MRQCSQHAAQQACWLLVGLEVAVGQGLAGCGEPGGLVVWRLRAPESGDSGTVLIDGGDCVCCVLHNDSDWKQGARPLQ